MRIHLILCVILAIVGLVSAEESASPAETGTVLAVHVKNGTQGGQVAEGTEVTVNFYQGQELIRQLIGATDAKGDCVFTNIPEGGDMAAVAQAKHSDMAFSSSPLFMTPGQKRYELSFQVFDVAYDNSLIRVGTHHIILKKQGSNLHITEYVQFVNDSDKAVLSDQYDEDKHFKVIEIALPENAKELSFSSYFNPDAIVRTQTGFYDTMAIPPGSYHAVFSYDVPLGTEQTHITKTVTLPTQSMMVFVQANSGIVTDFGEPSGQMALKDGTPTNYYTVAVSPGSVLAFDVEGVPAPPARQNIWIILGAVFAVVAVTALFRLLKRQPNA